MKVGVLTFEQYQGKKNLGSSRIRGHWLVDNWPEAELFVQGKKYDAVIYQKAYMVEHAKRFDGVKILDLCDPDFLHWGYKTKEMLDAVDIVTTSTEALAEAYQAFTDKPVVCVPDRIDLSQFQVAKTHNGDAKTVVWYGYSHNFDVLKPVVPILKRLKLDLMVISDGGFMGQAGYNDVEIKNLPFSWDTIQTDLLDADIVLNPQSKKGKWKYKSNNKTIMAWALGLPVADDVESLERFIKADARTEEQVLRNKELRDKWDIAHSVQQYKELIESVERPA